MAENTKFIYTRYLYNYTEVKQSLFVSLIEHNIDESLFWAFELYHSGFKESLFEYLVLLLHTLYTEHDHLIETILKFNVAADTVGTDDELLFGNLIATMSTKRYNLQEFCKQYLSVDVIQNTEERNCLNVHLTEEYIHTFRTNPNNDELRNILKYNARYNVHKEVNMLFNIEIPTYKELANMYNQQWLYYCYHCPIWQKRMNDYGGKVNDEAKTIVFENDDMHDAFYEKWGYDPDEQLLETKMRSLGAENVVYLDIKNLCKKFNLNMKLKTIRRSPSCKN
jgi:hypothetical protein